MPDEDKNFGGSLVGLWKVMTSRENDLYNAGLTLSPRLHVKPLITAIRAIACHETESFLSNK